MAKPLKKLKTSALNAFLASPKYAEKLVIESENDNEVSAVRGVDNGVLLVTKKLEFTEEYGDGNLQTSRRIEDTDLDEIEDDEECGVVDGGRFIMLIKYSLMLKEMMKMNGLE
ncbi:hypothetical protein Ancab_015576 [Ancistrocladus abbreviatus]